MKIDKTSFDFLKQIEKNNNREWFHEQKEVYNIAKQNLTDFLQSLVDGMNEHDSIEKSKLFRIYRDVRFSKDKTPYNTHYSMSMGRTKPHLRGGYYVRIQPRASMIVCGFFNPNKEDLLLIRKNIEMDQEAFEAAIHHPDVKSTFGNMTGDQVKTSPKGFSKDNPAIQHLRFKQFMFQKSYSDKEVLTKNFAKKLTSDFKNIRPFFNYMTEILNHDLNGIPLYT